MEKKRKIERVARKVSFAEAEELDDKYWSAKSEDERLKALIELRKIFFERDTIARIQKVVSKYNLYEETD